MKVTDIIPVYLVDSRNVMLSPYMKGNTKLGANVYTYSRLAGKAWGTCPGSSDECEDICYAKRIKGIVHAQYLCNTLTDVVPEIPAACQLLRLHVSGDFDTIDYTNNWRLRLLDRPDVTMWTYTRSWRVPELLPALEALRALPNVQLFASVDRSIEETPPAGWRRAWIDGDERAGKVFKMLAHDISEEIMFIDSFPTHATQSGTKALLCPEEIDQANDCEDCRFCFQGVRNDVVFLKH